MCIYDKYQMLGVMNCIMREVKPFTGLQKQILALPKRLQLLFNIGIQKLVEVITVIRKNIAK